MTRRRSAGDEARASIFYWAKRMRASGRRFPTREEILERGGSLDAVVFHMTKDNIAALSDEEAGRLLEFDPSADGAWPGPDWVRELLQEYDEEDTFFSAPTAQDVTSSPTRVGGRPKAEWTEDLWFACFARILNEGMFAKELELRKFVADWLSANGHYPSENTIKAKSREFWRRADLDKNP